MMQLVSGEANGKPLQEYGKRQIWLKICGQTKRYDFHVVDVTKPILSVSCLCENGVETHLANACVRADGCTEKTREYKLTDSQKT